ncbi:gliding motility-associated C-terminal domain-containing protein [Flavobacterium sp. F372]|uniref:Gliding motility-associated C-terminal domain-containing protein n=1 Tax=Flavobacterium bernardetii TaxID=2813823 RepID=A0ABR7J1N7_9FLAO|nr:gliding motility-associated C-terminal domain-containing protein [Flavobacterium bernardetii]MBC5835933.1 gliding motility-associated C-terminal domain-containing protein [Flavobacterium bernardetii]NHF71121.1 gliding motility-associated C-terminal domain-containing protein [Flavobacterium bernardetii]
MKSFYLTLLLGFFQFGFSQLSNFNLQITATDEFCSGNGTLNFSVSNTTAGATIVYTVFLLPNTTTPIATTTNSSLTGLSAGNYQVIANQSLGANTNSQQQNATISNDIENLTFTISHQKVKCGNDGVLTANVITGNAVSYELLTGPVTMPAQVSNVFSNLPVGNYSIRVFDICGNAVVNSFTLIQNYTPLSIFSLIENELTCSTVKLKANTNYSNGNIAYPLNVEFKVYPPNSAPPLIYTQTLTSFSNQGIEQITPRFDGNYFYDVKIIDACGNATVSNNNLINNNFSFVVFTLNGCSPKINISTTNAVYPYTIEFLISPAGYNPSTLNPGFPGPYFTQETELNVVLGNYSVKLTDACGKTLTVNFQVLDFETPVLGTASSNGCGEISFSINQVYDVTIQSVTLVSAPATYTGSLPENLSAFISTSGYNWTHTGFPAGNYVFHIVDSCGVLHIKNITVGSGQSASLSVNNYPECELGFGSVYGLYGSATITSLQILSAPNNYPFSLPHIISPATNNAFSLTNVPQGSYTVQMTSSCGNVQTDIINVLGYVDSGTTIEIQQFCSSFNLKFTHQGNGNQAAYGLQKFNAVTGNWEHPITGMQIINNLINPSNFYALSHNQWNINLSFLGKFRIIKAYRNFNFVTCIRTIKEFEVLGQPKVLNHNVINCGNGFSAIQLNAVGIGQLIYRITSKNNQPFFVNNGTNNVFSNLEPAIYNFQIEDSCGNVLNHQIQINTGFPIQITSNLCENQLSNLTVDTHAFLQYEWWKDGNPSNILSTTNVLTFNPFLSSANSGIYYVRIIHNGNPTSCLNTVKTYTILTQATPLAGLDSTINLCGLQNSINLTSYLSGTFDSNGNWEEITTSNSLPINGIWDATSVNYGVYKFKYVVNGFCASSDEAIITINIIEKPVITSMSTLYSVCKGEDLQINPNMNNSNYSYQWTGPNNFSSTNTMLQFNAIQSVSIGQYTLIVSNNGCNSDPFNFVIEVTSLPEFYINETCENNIKTLTAIPLNGTFDAAINFNWTGPNGFTSSLNPIQTQSGNIGDYSLTIEKNTCQVLKGISVLSTACQIPKGISPNDDGLNDYFDLSGFDVNAIKIYNRYGLEIYSKENGYKKEWYGQANNGAILPDATYFYVLKLNSGQSKTGWVYVTR